MRTIFLRNGLIGLILIVIAFLITRLMHRPPLIAELLVPIFLVLIGTAFFMAVLQKARIRGDAAFIRYFLVFTVLKIIAYIGISLFVLVAFRLEPKSFLLTLLGSYLVFTVFSIQWIMAERWNKKNSRGI